MTQKSDKDFTETQAHPNLQGGVSHNKLVLAAGRNPHSSLGCSPVRDKILFKTYTAA